MTDEAVSPLRQRMIEDMTIRKLAPKTQQGYIRTIKDFAVFLGRSPDTASFEDVRRYQLHLAKSGAHPPILNHAVSALPLAHQPGEVWVRTTNSFPASVSHHDPGWTAIAGRKGEPARTAIAVRDDVRAVCTAPLLPTSFSQVEKLTGMRSTAAIMTLFSTGGCVIAESLAGRRVSGQHSYKDR